MKFLKIARLVKRPLLVGQRMTAQYKFGRSGRILVGEVVRESDKNGLVSLSAYFFSTSSTSLPPDVVIICKWRLANGGAGNSNGNGNIEILVHAT